MPVHSESPYLGSQTAIECLRQQRGLQQVADAERILLAALEAPDTDSMADQVLAEYCELVVGTHQQAWRGSNSLAYVIAGGTALWIGNEVTRAFGAKVRIIKKPQQARRVKAA